MSNLNNEILLENLFEEALEIGLSDEAAEIWALEKFEDTPNPWDQVTGGLNVTQHNKMRLECILLLTYTANCYTMLLLT